MLNRNLLWLFVALNLSSCCFFNHKNTATKSPEVVIKQDPQEEQVVSDDPVMYSVTDEEISSSGMKPQAIYFVKNSAALSKESTAHLNNKILLEAKNPQTKRIVIEAHCDERGTEDYNERLSLRRGQSVKNYLIKNGVKSNKITVIGYGESKPIAFGHDEISWAKNRRVVSIALKK